LERTPISLADFFIFSGLFWIISYILVKTLDKNREHILLFFPFYVIFRTKRLNEWLRKLGQKYRKFWRIWFTIGVFVSIGFMIYGLYFFIHNVIELWIAPKPENAIQPMIPGVTVNFNIFSYLILPLLFIITFHEFSHAMASEADGLKVKSTGLIGAGLFYIILPGAFVEPDEFQLRSPKLKSWTKLRIFGAGTFTNAIQAGIALLLVLNFPAIISPFYGPNIFQVDYIVPNSEGGYNEGNILIGDKVLEINGTKIDQSAGISLTAILNNETSIQCSVGNILNLSVLDSQNQPQNRILTLGKHLFVGFNYKYNSESELEITNVYSKYQGGNNYKNLSVGMKFKAIDGFEFNTTEGNTLGYYLRNFADEGQVNFTKNDDTNISIYIDYWPLVLGAFEFRSFFTGAFFYNDSENKVYVERVLSDLTETGINSKNLFKGDQITHVNGNPVVISPETSFETYLLSIIGPITETTEILFTVIPKGSSSTTTRTVLFQPINKSYVFIGIQTSDYWLPKNGFASFLGSNFVSWLQTQLVYFYMVGFSITLFNMLPMIFPPLDGYLLIKELVNVIF
jgi:Zn-dependent protease